MAADGIAREAAARHGLPEEDFRADAEVQAAVLEALGLREGGMVVGQRPLKDRELLDALTRGRSGLARLLFGRNSFRASYLPLLRIFTQDMSWPLLCSVQPQAHLTELPTLELCAALATRVLCVARRLREAGHKRLIFLGIGSGGALAEASLALHLGASLGLAVDLSAELPLRIPYGDVEISIFATDSPEENVRAVNRTLEAPTEMRVLPLDRREAVRRFAAEAPVYVFSCWMPMKATHWLADVEEDAGAALAELCFLTAPPGLIEIQPSQMVSQHGARTELFPLTCSRFDFLARDFEDAGGEEAGLCHSQLYIFSEPSASPPFLAASLRHELGNYAARMEAHQLLKGVNFCRGLGLSTIRSPADLGAEIPAEQIQSLRDSCFQGQMAVDPESLEHQFLDVLRFVSGPAHKQISAVLRELRRRHPAPPA